MRILATSPLAFRGFAPRGLINQIFRILDLREFFWVGGWGCPTPQENSFKPSQNMRN